MNRKLQELEEKIGYQFRNRQLFKQALTHSSYANEHRLDHNSCNERLEFLGDAVLELSSSEFLYKKYQDLPEGERRPAEGETAIPWYPTLWRH